jgi:PDZ domain-containing protein
MEVSTMRRTLLILFALSGCALTAHDDRSNDYAKFFKPEAGATADALAKIRVAAPTGSPQVVPVAKWDSDLASSFARRGFVLIGSSSFTSGRPESDQDAINLGAQIGADLVVILSPEYKETVSASIPITLPTATTSQTNASATAYGSGGPVMAYGNSTTTTYGSNTTYVPMTVQRSAYGAGYFVRKRYRFGAIFRDLNDSERQQFQTNRGAYVATVVDNTPAYNGDILPGDVVVGLNGQTPNGAIGLTEMINANHGQTVDVTVIRAGNTISKRIGILE